jgi:hypothetical protein
MGLSKFIIDSKLPEMQGIYVDAYRTASQDLTTNKIIDTAAQLAISLVPLGGGLLTMRAAGAV